MLAKIILAITMAASAILGGAGTVDQEQATFFDGYYLHVDDEGRPSLWQEANGHAGLQVRTTVIAGGPVRFEIPADNPVLL